MGTFIFTRKYIDRFIKKSTFLEFIETGAAFFQVCSLQFSDEAHTLEEKAAAYHAAWKRSIDVLYGAELPGQHNPYPTGIEWTPFTILLAQAFDIDIMEQFQLTAKDRAYCVSLYKKLSPQVIPLTRQDEIVSFMLRILVIPPLVSIAEFYRRAYQENAKRALAVLDIVQNMPVEMPPYKVHLGLHLADSFIDQNMYQKYGGMEGLLSDPRFSALRPRLLEIKARCKTELAPPDPNYCSHCGRSRHYTVHQNDMFFILLVSHHKDVACGIALELFDDYKEMILEAFLRAVQDSGRSINEVRSPMCYLLVESPAEEKAIPYMALKYGKPLSTKRIRIWNAESRQKVIPAFERLVKSEPQARMCILLDGGAKEEIRRLQETIKGKEDRYVLFSIPGDGGFEDLIDPEIAVKALNKIYGDGTFFVDDFAGETPFVKRAEKLLPERRSPGPFERALFIETVLPMLRREAIPELVKRVIDECYCLADKVPVASNHL